MAQHNKNKKSGFPGPDINTKIEKTSSEIETTPNQGKEQVKRHEHKDYETIEEEKEDYKPGRSNKHWQ